MRAWLNLRHTVSERQRVFSDGLRRLGYRVETGLCTNPGPNDILVSWNRIREGHIAAKAFEQRGNPVLITENAYWGNDFAGEHWYCLGLNRHNTAGRFPIGDNNRWDDLGIELQPFRTEGETVILPQRGIGADPTRMPHRWGAQALELHGGRIRPHPGTKPCKSLEDDLKHCGRVITWGSGAAIKALMWGIPVTSYMPDWIAEQDNTDEGRLAMFRRLAWGNSRLSEFESGEAFARVLEL